MSKEAELMCGPYSIPWDSFVNIGSKVLETESARQFSASNVSTWSRKVADATILRRLVAGAYSAGDDKNMGFVSAASILQDASRVGGNSAWYLLKGIDTSSETIVRRGPVSLALALPLLTS